MIEETTRGKLEDRGVLVLVALPGIPAAALEFSDRADNEPATSSGNDGLFWQGQRSEIWAFFHWKR
jgi:hypothetical protein